MLNNVILWLLINSCENCLWCLLAIPDQFPWILLVRGKGFHISKLPHGTHIMFSWDYYLDDFCSVITLHVTVQRCSPNINSLILPPHGFERTVKLSFSVTASVVLSQSSHLPCLPNFFVLIIDQNGHYFLVNFRVIESCIWFYCF